MGVAEGVVYKVTVTATSSKASQPPGTQAMAVEQVRLVRAKNRAQAKNHVAEQSIKVEPVDVEAALLLAKECDGLTIERAGEVA